MFLCPSVVLRIERHPAWPRVLRRSDGGAACPEELVPAYRRLCAWNRVLEQLLQGEVALDDAVALVGGALGAEVTVATLPAAAARLARAVAADVRTLERFLVDVGLFDVVVETNQ